MKINIQIIYPDNIEILEKEVVDLLASILIKKFKPREIDKLLQDLKDDSNNIKL